MNYLNLSVGVDDVNTKNYIIIDHSDKNVIDNRIIVIIIPAARKRSFARFVTLT